MSPEQSPQSPFVIPKSVTPIARACALESINLIEAHVHARDYKGGDYVDRMSVDLRIAGQKWDVAPQTIVCLVGVKLYCYAKEDSNRLVAEMSCDHALRYMINDVALYETLDLDRIVEFASINGLYNAWPYIREYFQSSASRMMLPPVTIPTLSENVLKLAKIAADKHLEQVKQGSATP